MLTSQKIINYIRDKGLASGKGLVDYLGTIGPRAVRKQLKNMLERGVLTKKGRPPKVYYLLVEEKEATKKVKVDKKVFKVIEDNYLFISPLGEAKYGWDGFVAWCQKTKQDPVKTAKEYVSTLKKYSKLKKGDFIDGLRKIKQSFSRVFLDKLFYLDFYSIERFGKTKLGQMLLYAKQSQDKVLIRRIVGEVRSRIESLVAKYKIDGVLFVPPTVKREVQFMKELENGLKLPIKVISAVKIKTEVIVPQKTLSRLDDRVENAKRTIVVDDLGHYKNILIIDDAVGSGATINETAGQIKMKKMCEGKIFGLAITGSFKGFDVISEV